MNASTTTVLLLLLSSPNVALAQPSDDGYCDQVAGTASAAAATLFAPQLFGQFGYIEDPAVSSVLSEKPTPNNVRVIAGIRYSFTNIFVGKATKSRAEADCRRHQAQTQLQALAQQMRDTTAARAIAARLQVFDGAQAQADRLLAESQADLDSRRIAAQEAMATRLRVEDLRTQASQARRELAALPSPDLKGVETLVANYRAADADLERSEGALRSLAAYDVNIRTGVDRFAGGTDSTTRYFAVLEVGINLGALTIGRANRRSAAGRSRFARSTDLLGVVTNPDQLRAMIEIDTKRSTQVTALVADLDRQLAALAGADGGDGKRFRETVWFESIKAKAELAYLDAHIVALREGLAH